jgi:hypothetical protein
MYDFSELSQPIKLSAGNHNHPEDGMCAMEFVSWLVGEPFSDQPECVCPILARVAIHINDQGDQEMRDKLLLMLPDMVGTRSTSEDAIARAHVLWQFAYNKYGHLIEEPLTVQQVLFEHIPHDLPKVAAAARKIFVKPRIESGSFGAWPKPQQLWASLGFKALDFGLADLFAGHATTLFNMADLLISVAHQRDCASRVELRPRIAADLFEALPAILAVGKQGDGFGGDYVAKIEQAHTMQKARERVS